MNIRDLKYLVAVAEYQHFGKAADACFVSQPALSMQLKKLEESVGVQLFERSNKHVCITPAGEALALQAQKILLGVDDFMKTAKAYQDPLAGDFRLGAFPTLAPYYLPKVIPAIHKALPKLKLLLIEEKTSVLLEKLKSGVLDAALIALPIDGDGLESIKLFDDPFLLAVAPDHILAKRKVIHQHDLTSEKLLLLEDGHCLRSQALEVCSLVGSSEEQEFRATSLETLRQMVATGVGITLIPQLAIGKDKSVNYIPFEGLAPSRTIGLVWRKHTVRQKCIAKIVSLLL
jgi:LysR family hydrogen peroxide-inducible transcriptional activator